MVIKGFVNKGEKIYLTCCNEIQDIKIENTSLYKILDGFIAIHKLYSMRFILLDSEPKKSISDEDLFSEVIIKNIYSQYDNGCYSEWTCGFGGIDYIHSEGGHSIFNELKESIGKYIVLEINELEIKD